LSFHSFKYSKGAHFSGILLLISQVLFFLSKTGMIKGTGNSYMKKAKKCPKNFLTKRMKKREHKKM